MPRFPFYTTSGPYGPFHTVPIAPLLVHIVGEAHFDSIASTADASAKQFQGEHFVIFGRCNADSTTEVFIKNRKPATVESIHRDDAWQKRLELAGVFADLFLKAESTSAETPAGVLNLTPAELRHDLPMSLLTPVYLEAFSNVSKP